VIIGLFRCNHRGHPEIAKAETMSHQDIISKVSTCFDKALDLKDILFFPSTITKHVDLGVEVRQEVVPIMCSLTARK
jgi:hypothetical protein